jgi:thiamine biosynthesis lipoprotein
VKRSVELYWLLFAVLVFSLPSFTSPQLKRFQLSGFAQGTTWQLTYYAADSSIAKSSVDSILDVIDRSMSLYQPNSLISQFNRSPRGGKVDLHFRKVIEKSFDVSRISAGMFDITVKPLVQVWGFGSVKSDTIPAEPAIKSALACVGINNLRICRDSLIKSNPCVEVDVNGIAQGYTVDVIAQFLAKKSVVNYLVELGGELRVEGRKDDGSRFMLGIEAPDGNDENPITQVISVKEGAITTSGNYRQFKKDRGVKYSHLINPLTGYPIRNEMISVTVWAKDAATADGFDNVFMNWGVEKSLAFLKGRKDMAAYFIYVEGDKIRQAASPLFLSFFKDNVSVQ